jgi:hypothetical protein
MIPLDSSSIVNGASVPPGVTGLKSVGSNWATIPRSPASMS